MDTQILREVMEGYIPFNRFLGIRLVDLDKGRARLEIPFRPEFVGDPMRPALHGGIISTLADTAGGAAVWSALDDTRARVSTIDLRIDYLRPGKLEALLADATIVRLGKRLAVVDIALFQHSAPTEIVATGKGVFNITIPREKK